MSDPISRQEAIDAFDKQFWSLLNIPICKEIRKAAKDTIKALPPVQPEIIRCKDCKHRDVENGLCEGRGWPMQLVPDDGFCDKGERITDE